MSHYKPYPAYKDSAVEWLGDVPSEWDVRPLKYGADFVNGCPFKPEQWADEGSPIIRIENLNGSVNFNYFAGQVDPRYHVVKGDLLFGWSGNRGTSFGPVVWPHDGQFFLNQHIFKVCGFSFKKSWFYWCLKALTVYVEKQAHGIIGMVHITKGDLGQIKIAQPSREEQRLIAAHLDFETSRIDGLISKKTRFIELLREKRQAMITNAVTKGLDSKVPMKDSGVEWLGQVPAHWVVCKLNFRYSVELGKMLDEKRITGVSLVPYLRNQDVQWGAINTESLPEMDIYDNELERYTVKNGDLLVCEGGDVGRAAIWQGGDHEVGFQKALHRLRIRSTIDDTAKFFYFSLLAAKGHGIFEQSDASATIAHLPAEKFRQYRFAFPPLLEQTEITLELKRRIARLDTLISATEASMALLKERRGALITAAVTGQIDLREAA